MEFGADFDDDFFEEPKERHLNGPAKYEPKVFKPLWFMDTDSNQKSEEEDALHALKHQADHHYSRKCYSKAAETYERCLGMVPPGTNTTWRREFMENIARAHLNMGQPEKALEWSFELDKSSCNADQKIVSMNLLAAVCHKLKKYAEELEALHCCLEAHKLCPEFWQRLALCYAGLFKLRLPDFPSTPDQEPEDEELCCDFKAKRSPLLQGKDKCSKSASAEELLPSPNSDLVCPSLEGDRLTAASEETCTESSKCELCMLGIQIVSSCLIRTRMLMDSGGPSHLTAQRDECLKEKIANCLKHMEVDQDFIDVASQMLGGEFSTILQRPDSTLDQHSSLLNHKEQDPTDGV
ncbi:hypothetical protein JTE90_005511 [Oedothorax gibbosus]|uniref:Uncharacterized protein n=1 Tax=Oedothorax gibbosus TaxID=931172 RepID=A0AAV6UV27_9ARAC|nr:hypothetical protein JTE90_005511 [Oedothorax gibbosus]